MKLGVDGGDADKQAKGLDDALGDLKDTMQAVVVVGAAVTAAIVGVATSAAAAGDAAAKGAQRTGIAVERYQELAFAARQAKVSEEQFEQSLTKTALVISQVADETGIAIDAFAELGLNATELGKLSIDQQMVAMAEALSGVASESDRLLMAQQIYGEDLAGKLLPLFNKGAAGIAEMSQMANDLGIVMSAEATEGATEFADTMDQAWQIVVGIKNAIGLELLPTLTDLLARFRDWSIANRAVIATRLERWMNVIVEGIDAVVGAFEFVDKLVVATLGGWGPVFKAAAVLVGLVGLAMAGIGALKVWAALQGIVAFLSGGVGIALTIFIAKIAAVMAIVIGLGLVIEDLIVFFRGGDSALGRFLDTFRESDGFLGAVARRFEQIIAVATRLMGIVKLLGGVWWEVFSRTTLPALKLVAAGFMFLARVIGNVLAAVWDNIGGPVFDRMIMGADVIMEKLEALMPMFNAFLGVVDGALGALSSFTGVDLTTGGGEAGTAPAAAGTAPSVVSAADAISGSTFAPSGTEAAGTAAVSSSRSTQNTIQGNTYTINGVGWTEADLLDLISQSEAERARQTSAALEGGEV